MSVYVSKTHPNYRNFAAIPNDTSKVISGDGTYEAVMEVGTALANIVEIIPHILKNVCENTSFEVISDSELGNNAVRSIVVSRLNQKLKSHLTSV